MVHANQLQKLMGKLVTAEYETPDVEQKLTLVKGLGSDYDVKFEAILSLKYEFSEGAVRLTTREMWLGINKSTLPQALLTGTGKETKSCYIFEKYSHLFEICGQNSKTNHKDGERRVGICKKQKRFKLSRVVRIVRDCQMIKEKD